MNVAGLPLEWKYGRARKTDFTENVDLESAVLKQTQTTGRPKDNGRQDFDFQREAIPEKAVYRIST